MSAAKLIDRINRREPICKASELPRRFRTRVVTDVAVHGESGQGEDGGLHRIYPAAITKTLIYISYSLCDTVHTEIIFYSMQYRCGQRRQVCYHLSLTWMVEKLEKSSANSFLTCGSNKHLSRLIRTLALRILLGIPAIVSPSPIGVPAPLCMTLKWTPGSQRHAAVVQVKNKSLSSNENRIQSYLVQKLGSGHRFHFLLLQSRYLSIIANFF